MRKDNDMNQEPDHGTDPSRHNESWEPPDDEVPRHKQKRVCNDPVPPEFDPMEPVLDPRSCKSRLKIVFDRFPEVCHESEYDDIKISRANRFGREIKLVSVGTVVCSTYSMTNGKTAEQVLDTPDIEPCYRLNSPQSSQYIHSNRGNDLPGSVPKS